MRWGVQFFLYGNNDPTEDPMDASYDTFIAMLRTARKLTYAQRMELKAAAPFGYNRLGLYRDFVPSDDQFAREHHSQNLWDTLAPVGEWMLENVW